MTTAADVVTDACLAAGVGDLYNPLDATSSAMALRALNRLLDSWSTESLIVFNSAEDNFAMTPGVAAYSTALLTQRPVEVTHAFVRQSGVDYQCALIGPEDYAAIAFKGTSGLPARCYFNSGMPNGTLTYFPVPSTPYQAYVGYRGQLANLASLQIALSLPPGYERALVFGLACEIAPMFGVQPTDSAIFLSRSSKKKLRAANYSLDESRIKLPVGRGLFNIYRGS